MAVRRDTVLTIRNMALLGDLTIRLDSPLVVVTEEGPVGQVLLRAIRYLVDPGARMSARDFHDPNRPVEIGVAGPDGEPILGLRAERLPGGLELQRTRSETSPPGTIVYMDAARRAGLRFPDIARRLGLEPLSTEEAGRRGRTPTTLLQLCELCLACDVQSAWILIEAPELFMGPHAQRALASLLRALAGCGNQVVYSTYSPNLVDGQHTDGILRIARDRTGSLTAYQGPHTPPADVPDLVRRLSSFDRERNGMFFARRVLLVEGASERLSLPFAFRHLGIEADAEGVAITDAGGKGNLPFLARTLRALAIPTVVLHDRDAPADRAPSREHEGLNQAIREAAGGGNAVQMAPDFETVSGLRAHVRHKPSKAWLHYAEMASASELPPPIVDAIQRLMAL